MVVGEEFTSTDTSIGNDDMAHVEWDATPDDCPTGTKEVRTFFAAAQPASFGETDVGGFDLSNVDQGFSFVIP